MTAGGLDDRTRPCHRDRVRRGRGSGTPRCPWCGSTGRLLVVARVMAVVTHAGAVLAPGAVLDWDGDSFAVCPDCDHDGPLAGFGW